MQSHEFKWYFRFLPWFEIPTILMSMFSSEYKFDEENNANIPSPIIVTWIIHCISITNDKKQDLKGNKMFFVHCFCIIIEYKIKFVCLDLNFVFGFSNNESVHDLTSNYWIDNKKVKACKTWKQRVIHVETAQQVWPDVTIIQIQL